MPRPSKASRICRSTGVGLSLGRRGQCSKAPIEARVGRGQPMCCEGLTPSLLRRAKGSLCALGTAIGHRADDRSPTGVIRAS
jgi:hypothetical protein